MSSITFLKSTLPYLKTRANKHLFSFKIWYDIQSLKFPTFTSTKCLNSFWLSNSRIIEGEGYGLVSQCSRYIGLDYTLWLIFIMSYLARCVFSLKNPSGLNFLLVKIAPHIHEVVLQDFQLFVMLLFNILLIWLCIWRKDLRVWGNA